MFRAKMRSQSKSAQPIEKLHFLSLANQNDFFFLVNIVYLPLKEIYLQLGALL